MLNFGLDLGLTATGLVAIRRTRVVHRSVFLTTKADAPYDDQTRQHFIVTGVLARLPENEPCQVLVEDHAFGVRNADTRVHELGGIIKRELWMRTVVFDTVAPNTVKRFATGSGTASKEQMMEAAETDGFDLPRGPRGGWGPGADDLADAYWTAKLCCLRKISV